MYDSIYIGDTAPFGESCVQVGNANYARLASAEAHMFIEQIIEHYGEEPGSGHLHIVGTPHDFGSYLSVEYKFRSDDDEAMEYGFDVEGDVKNALEYWDEDKKSAASKIINGEMA